MYFSSADRMAESKQSEDLALIHKYKVDHYDPMQDLPSMLLSGDESSNLNFYFDKYLSDKDFKKPLHNCGLKLFKFFSKIV